jgi:hypothetical protein
MASGERHSYRLSDFGRSTMMHDGVALQIQTLLSGGDSLGFKSICARLEVGRQTLRRRISSMVELKFLIVDGKREGEQPEAVGFDAAPLERALRIPKAVQPMPWHVRRHLCADTGRGAK